MTYKRIKPKPALSDLVEYFGIQTSNELSDSVTHVLPTNQHDLLIHFADPFFHHEESAIVTEPFAHLCGQRTRPYKVSASGRTGIVICSFYPWAVYELTGEPMGRFTNATVEAREVFPGIDQVIDKMFCLPNHDAQIELLQTYLISLLKAPNLFVRQTCQLLQTNLAPIGDLANELGLSKRHLDRRFLDAVGLTPKTFSRVNRFQRSLGFRLSKQPAATIAAHCGYHDQAHMNRELKILGGNTAGRILNQTDSTPLLSQFNAPMANASRFYNTLYLQ